MAIISEFHWAIQSGELNKVKQLLSADSSLAKTKDSLGRPPLQNPCWDGNIEMVELLLSYGADVNAQNRDNVTPLHSATSKGDPRVIKLLLEHGAEVNAKTKNSSTPLHIAAEFRFIDTNVADLLLRYGADVNAKDSEGKTPLDVAIKSREESPMVTLLKTVAEKS